MSTTPPFVAVALKYPGGIVGQVCRAPKYTWEQIPDINDWIYSTLFVFDSSHSANTTVPFVVSWNDQRATNDGVIRSDARVGHTKGVMVVTKTETRLLIHSVPVFPNTTPSLTPKEKYTIPPTAHKYGQSFLCVRLNCGWGKNQADYITLCNQLRIMNPNFFGNAPFLRLAPRPYQPRNSTLQLNLVPGKRGWLAYMRTLCRCFSAGPESAVYHVAKPPNHCTCIYEYLVEQFGGPCRAATWVKRPRMLPSSSVAHVVDIRACAPIPTTHEGRSVATTYQSSNDHSKWAVSTHVPCRVHPCWVWFGDLNRMESQKARGGGGILVVGNVPLWTAVHSLCQTVSECV